MPYHAWFIHDGLHYDATSPEGVQDFYQLDFFQYYLNLTNEERQKSFASLNEAQIELATFMNE